MATPKPSLQWIIRRRQEEWVVLGPDVVRALIAENLGHPGERRAQVMRLAEQAQIRAHFKSVGGAA